MSDGRATPDRVPSSPYSKEAVLKREAEEAARCHASSNSAATPLSASDVGRMAVDQFGEALRKLADR